MAKTYYILAQSSKRIPTIPITALDLTEIPHHFNLTHCLPTEFELSPSETEMISPPSHLSSIFPDCDIATSRSPPNKALIRSRVDVIILTVLAKVKREFAAKPSSSVASASLESVHLKFERKMKFVWKSGKQRVTLSGIVDYSLWYGMPDDHATNMVMINMVTMDLLKFGVYQCLAYMAIIHETRKQADIPDPSMYELQQTVPSGCSSGFGQMGSSQEIVSMLVKTLAHAASFDPQTGQKRRCHRSEPEFSTPLEQRKSKR
ncbi:unnamed protein product [Penicillium nalgiovense]|nr:unnamed protein product [Penicillium nalgiovense]